MEHLNLLDLALLLFAALAVLLGWRVGLVCGLITLLSVVVGGTFGFLLGRSVLDLSQKATPEQAIAILASTVVGIFLAQLIVIRPTQRMHDAVMATPLRRVNTIGGSILTLGFGLVIVWMLATALALAPSTQLASLMRGSTVLIGLDRTIPVDAGPLFSQLETVGLQTQPRVFTGLGLLPVPAVEAPPKGAVTGEARRVAEQSVVRILGRAECGPTLAGSGVVVGKDLVLTNAHVVAGIAHPLVFSADRRIGVPAVPVLFDPIRDVALLKVRGLNRPAVPVSQDPQTSDLVAVSGFPNAGELQVQAAAVRGVVRATGSDIYGQGQARRDVVVIEGDVMAGDSGGPLLSPAGEIVGLIFASAFAAGEHTGYALSASEVRETLAAGVSADGVGTGLCVPE